jgi:hypothetical protein
MKKIAPSFSSGLFAFAIVVSLVGCGGGGESSASGSGARVYGAAATGLAMNGTVTLKDADGVTLTAAISQPSGGFKFDVTGLTPPYFLKATENSGVTTLYSVATGTGNFNINPLTNLAVIAAAMGIDPLARTPDEVFNNPAKFANLTPAQLKIAMDKVMAQLSPAFQAELAANGVNNVNPLTDPFQVGNGLDKVFDNFVIVMNPATNEIQERQVGNNTMTVLGMVDMLGTFPAAGVYDGTVSSSGVDHLVSDVLITSAGEMRYVMDNGVQVIAALTVSGSTVNGTGTAFAPTLNGQPTNFRFADGSTSINLTINGTLGTDTLTGTYTYGNFTDTFSFTLNAQKTSNPSSLSKIAGTYVSASDGNATFIGHIEEDGKIWGSGSDIGYSGLIQIVDPDNNIYRVTLAYLQNGTSGFVSGLATFHDTAPDSVTLPMPEALVPAGYTGDIASLSYGQSASGNQGMLVMLLSSPSLQKFVEVVKLSSQLQDVVVHPTPDTLMMQGFSNQPFYATSLGDVQYSSASNSISSSYIISSTGMLNLIWNPGNIALNGFDTIKLLLAQIPPPSSIPGVVPVTDNGTTCTTSNTGNITPPPAGTLIITASPACKTYDGLPYSGGNGVTYDGFLNGDTPAVLGGTLTYVGTSQGAKNAGTYTITPGGLASDSYNVVYVDGTLTINPLKLPAVITNNINKIYDDTWLVGTGVVGFIGGESVTSGPVTLTNSGPVTLTNSSTVTLTNTSVGTLTISGLSASNYSLAYDGVTATAIINSGTLGLVP